MAVTSARQVRLAFVALALVLLIPMALLIQRALASDIVERERSHEAVAARIFDEVERELSSFLRREEDRPFEQYRNLVLPSQGLKANLTLESSPLAEPPSDAFVIGYFQIEPDGTVTSPHKIDSVEAQSGVDNLKRTIREHWQRREAGGRVQADKELDAGRDASLLEDSKAAGALSELNRAAVERRERRTKLSQAPAANVYNFSSDEDDNVLQRASPSPSPSASQAMELEQAVEETLQKKIDEPVDVRLEPMVGSAVNESTMVLYRTVVIDRAGYRQGMLLDVPILVRWLEGRVLASNSLDAFARMNAIGAPPSLGELNTSYEFRHAFAEPFAPVTAALSLAMLPELSPSGYVATLSALLVLAATLGLFDVYRRVSVTVAFAERRQNFVSAVSHELKTPLTAIRMYGEMLRDNLVASEDKRQRYYEVITAETERLSRLVDNVLELGRLERKERSVRTAALDVRPVLEEALAVLEPHAESEGFRIELDVEPDLPRAQFERDALSQVLFNLLDNAVKYARRGDSRCVRLSARRDGARVCLEVRDGGPGVRPEHLGKIFDPFFRAESELTRTAKGTGIGLALVKGLVEKMGGSVEARNLDEGGFVIRVRLKS